MDSSVISQSKEVSGRVWPDGSFGWRTHKRNQKFSLPKIHITEEVLSRVAILSVYGLQAYQALFSECNEKEVDHMPTLPSESGADSGALGLAEATNYHKRKSAPRGSRGITSQNRKTVRSVGTLLEFRYGKDRLSFATLTMPSLTPEDRVVCQQQWSRSVQVFYQEMTRYFARKGLKFIYVGVTEIQPKRSEREGWNAPHLHFVFLGKQGKTWTITPSKLRQLWKRTWHGHFSSSYCWDLSENLVRVKKSVAGYLSKYLSKGGKSTSANAPVDSWFPSSWVSLNLTMKNWLKKTCVSVGDIFPIISSKEQMCALFSRHGQKTVKAILASGQEIPVGVAGWIDAREWLEFLGAFWPEKLTYDPLAC